MTQQMGGIHIPHLYSIVGQFHAKLNFIHKMWARFSITLTSILNSYVLTLCWFTIINVILVYWCKREHYSKWHGSNGWATFEKNNSKINSQIDLRYHCRVLLCSANFMEVFSQTYDKKSKYYSFGYLQLYGHSLKGIRMERMVIPR